MPEKANILEAIIVWGGVVATWVAGEAGRGVVSGASGGLFRFFMSEKLRLRDGVIAVITGVIAARELSSITAAIIKLAVPSIENGPDLDRTAAFAAGLGGMTIAKIVLALLEAFAAKTGVNTDDK